MSEAVELYQNPALLMQDFSKHFVTLLTQYVADKVNGSGNSNTNISSLYNNNLFNAATDASSTISPIAVFVLQLVTFLSTTLLQNHIFCAGISIMILTYCYNVIKSTFYSIYDYSCSFFVYSLEVKGWDSSFRYINYWLSKQPCTHRSRYSALQSSWDHNKSGNYNDDDSDDESDAEASKPHLYTVAKDDCYFFFKKRLVWVTRGKEETKNNHGNNAQEYLTISTFSTSKQVLMDLISEAMNVYFKKDVNKTLVYTIQEGGWQSTCIRDHRELDSVILPAETKQTIIDDIARFYKNTDWYKRTGIPRKRGYLLYGPPGTGKTSLILALAARFKLNVCLLTLSSYAMNDNDLNKLMSSAPTNSIILIEDVDAAFSKKRAKIEKSNENNDSLSSSSNGVTFSGLLNALDGVAAQSGRIIFLTTNYIERLDSALIRPGRIDLKVKINYATCFQISEIYKRFFPEFEGEAERVSNLFPTEELTPAEIQSLFMQHQDAPAAIDEIIVQAFLKDCLLTRKVYEQKQEEAANAQSAACSDAEDN